MSNRLKLILFQIVFVGTSVIVIEIVLRQVGYRPGDLKPNWLNFHPVDSLYVIHDYYTNSKGILVADSNFWAERNVHINEGGFRSPDFSKIDSSKKKILFIGDSFTWGMTAEPVVGNCFVDLIRSETNFEVINLGIPAADPMQYEALAKEYIPKLNPDLVVVVFFMGNDLMKQERTIIPNEPFYYYTNAGALLADIDGIHFKTAQAAYNYFVNDKYYLHQPKNIFETLVAKSSLLSRLYSVRFRIAEKIEYEKLVKDSGITRKHLTSIKSIAAQNKTLIKFLLIPEIKEADMLVDDYKKKYAALLQDSALNKDWLFPQNVKLNFNDYPDAHLNNNGHRFYADYLKDFLETVFNSK